MRYGYITEDGIDDYYKYFNQNQIIEIVGEIKERHQQLYLCKKHKEFDNMTCANIRWKVDDTQQGHSKWTSYIGRSLESYKGNNAGYLWLGKHEVDAIQENRHMKNVLEKVDD